jgi:diazepam-binding inhibitor (GABA receptor modulating acyl-CoA-binding protein)
MLHILTCRVIDFTGKTKWDAWKKNEGMSQEDAKKKYVETLLNIFSKSGK